MALSPLLLEIRPRQLHPTPDYFNLGIKEWTQVYHLLRRKGCPPLARLSQTDYQRVEALSLPHDKHAHISKCLTALTHPQNLRTRASILIFFCYHIHRPKGLYTALWLPANIALWLPTATMSYSVCLILHIHSNNIVTGYKGWKNMNTSHGFFYLSLFESHNSIYSYENVNV